MNSLADKEEKEMSFLDHLEALRWHLVRSAIAVLAIATFAFINKRLLFDVILFAPKKSDFITFRVFCKLSEKLSSLFPGIVEKGTICIGQDMPKLQNIHMSGQFTTHITVSVIAGLVIAFPYIFWELWRFIKPALKETEKKYTSGVVFFGSSLFLSGIMFGYFLVVPLAVNFLLNYQVSEEVINLPTLTNYISLVTMIALACGFVFELPLMVYFLSKIGLIGPEFLRKYRKHSIVVILIIAAIITPSPDIFSQLLVAFPLYFLYEISIFISAGVVKKQAA